MYCWGDNRFGQLALESQENIKVHFQDNYFFQDKAEVQKVAIGGQHTVFLLEDGTIFSCGQNIYGQLGRRTNHSNTDQILALEAQTIVDVSCGTNHSMAVCNQGNVFSWGEASEGELGTGQSKQRNPIPRRISGLSNTRIIQISCGHFHSVALSEDGRVFSWGQNNAGQLGLGKKVPNQASPQIVKSLQGIPLVQVTAAGCQSFALSMLGTVFGWGRNNAGQLGFKTDVSRAGVFNPHAVSSLRSLGVVYISCGDEHSAVLTKGGSVYTFGDDTYGQLGQQSRNSTPVPQKIEEYEGQVSQICCGSYHTLLYVYTCNRVVSFGSGSQHQDDNASNNDQAQTSQQPQEFNISSLVSANDLTDIYVKRIFAGNNVCFASCTNQQQDSKQASLIDSLQKISRVDSTVIYKWMNAKNGSEEYQEAKREISTIFSSPSCLTASFLKSSTSNPLQTYSLPVDLEAASRIFTNLHQDKRISEIICSSLKSDLIPVLASLPLLSEALSIFLLLPELPIMHEPENTLPLVVPFANTVNNLSTDALRILGQLWSSLTAPALTKQIEMLKIAVIICVQTNQEASKTRCPLEMLKRLYRINMKAKYKVPASAFYIDQVCPLIIIPLDLAFWREGQAKSDSEENGPVIFCRYPFIFNFPTKVSVLRYDFILKKTNTKIEAQEQIQINRMQGSSELPKIPLFHLKVRRSHLIQDTIHKLSIAEDCDFQKDLLVEFHKETSTNPPVVLREFFLYNFDHMVNPDYGMFSYHEKSSVMWFPSKPCLEKKQYFYFGVLCGLAISNQAVVYLPFPEALFKKLLEKKTTLDDLKQLDPTIGKSMQHIVDAEKVDNLALYFCFSWENKTVELIPNGATFPVTNSNKNEYVDKCIDYIFNSSVAEIFEEFKRGLYKVCDKDILSFFQPEELMIVTIGSENCDWKAFETVTVYLGKYSREHPTIKMFWKVFHALSEKDKRAFLLFVTGNDRGPVFHPDCLKIQISNFGVPNKTFLPAARPCLQMLILPEYSDLGTLRKKLLLAIQHNKGFWKM
ncbi:probable E3 ubiquitin-protein ligase HERC6 [Pelobates fuscus]|uniref:probable E3 ubiquitin-protein ligase HERC6 n=1 Tax=Pelobates fuscus TaxID=191477 RepID=UPI002FE439A7